MITIWFDELSITINRLTKKEEIEVDNYFYKFCTSDIEGNIKLNIIVDDVSEEDMLGNYKDKAKYFLFKVESGNMIGFVSLIDFIGTIFIKKRKKMAQSLEYVCTRILSTLAPYFGYLLIHGSCAVIDYSVCCFIGDSSVGKTTMMKMLSSHNDILAEDLTFLKICSNEFYVVPIPIGQECFWNCKKERFKLNNIFFVFNGTLSIEKIDTLKYYNLLSLHQMYKFEIVKDSRVYMSNFYIKKIINSINGYRLSYAPINFYKKNRRYVNDLLEKIIDTINIEKIINDHEVSYKKNLEIRIRNSIKSNMYEAWNPSCSQLFGITIIIKQIYNKLPLVFSYSDFFNQFSNIETSESLIVIFNEMLKNGFMLEKITAKNF